MSRNLLTVKEIKEYIKKKKVVRPINYGLFTVIAAVIGSILTDLVLSNSFNIMDSIEKASVLAVIAVLFLPLAILLTKNNYFHIDKGQEVGKEIDGYDFHVICKYFEDDKTEYYGNLYLNKNSFKFVSYEVRDVVIMDHVYDKSEVLINTDVKGSKLLNNISSEYLVLNTEAGKMNFIITCPDKIRKALDALNY